MGGSGICILPWAQEASLDKEEKKAGLRYRLPIIAKLLLSAFLVAAHGPASASPPVIDIWYGDNQTFGLIGDPQWVANLLGSTADPNSR